ncbi:MAG: PLP-dependent aminotransferase family protein [Gammaproteobacteria bacterium]|nr:PLP-dependent aminotransferase family protein [Gammaproteobacteria bacterium]MBV9697323.1 PLP-dependent aminotransferase family protein [Gammaproteobacteria bacterium]
MALVKPSAIRELLKLGAQPDIVSFGGGYPDPGLFPLDELAAVFEEAIRGRGRRALQYTVSAGDPQLRAQIAERMAREGIRCGADEILILQGAQQGLDLVAKMFIDRGDTIVTENPTFLGALIAFNPYEPRYLAVPTDNDGMDVEALGRLLTQRGGAKLLYTMPDFQNPSGVTLSLPRRHRLLELAKRLDFMILEDTPYREIRYEGVALPTLKSLDTEERVIHLRSFSKILAPGLRLGWVVASADLINRLGLLKLAADTQCSTLSMAATSLYLERYDVEAHIGVIRETYRRKKEAMVTAIREYFPASVACTNPQGGMFTWLTFPRGFDAARFLAEEALPRAKVAYVPGATFFPVQEETHHARFSYTLQDEATIRNSIAKLGALFSTSQAMATAG